jgi:hypothetical protein
MSSQIQQYPSPMEEITAFPMYLLFTSLIQMYQKISENHNGNKNGTNIGGFYKYMAQDTQQAASAYHFTS